MFYINLNNFSAKSVKTLDSQNSEAAKNNKTAAVDPIASRSKLSFRGLNHVMGF